MKNLILVSILIISFTACNQKAGTKPAKQKAAAAYSLPIPTGWTTETFAIPISFAPQISYTGIEVLRFAPGWAKQDKDDYWSYTFLWCLENNPAIDAGTIETNLKFYYDGLIRINMQKYVISKDKLFPTEVVMEKTTTFKDDNETYKGTIQLLDYMTQQPITFNCIVHVRTCAGNLFVCHEISPKPFEAEIWKSLDLIWTGFECGANGDK